MNSKILLFLLVVFCTGTLAFRMHSQVHSTARTQFGTDLNLGTQSTDDACEAINATNYSKELFPPLNFQKLSSPDKKLYCIHALH